MDDHSRPTLFGRLTKALISQRVGESSNEAMDCDRDRGNEFGVSLRFAPLDSSILFSLKRFTSDFVAVPHSTMDWLIQACAQYLTSLNSPTRKDSTETESLLCDIVSICKRFSLEEGQQALYDRLGDIGWEFIGEILRSYDAIKTLTLPGKLPEEGDHYHTESETTDWLQKVGFSDDFLSEERSLGLQKNRVFDGIRSVLPIGSGDYHSSARSIIPSNAIRTIGQGFEEIFVPIPVKLPQVGQNDLISVDELPPNLRPVFSGTQYFNRIQSRVFHCAFRSNENMLICAPTGAGKTNIAMLAILRLLMQKGLNGMGNAKIIYIAPMKALAQEVVAKFSQRLSPLGLNVREYTGDVQLSKAEIANSHLLVCTPEKYDSATRKGGDGSLITMVSLLIIDEVHLLADERGAVIETIVARTHRHVESSQNPVRIVGLSATLPNYKDVASFLGVNEVSGLFFFGPEYRPIPLDQTFIGLTEKSRPKREEQMNMKVYEKMVAALEAKKQVMIFVHARRETSKTIRAILDLCSKFGSHYLLENSSHEKYVLYNGRVERSKSQEVRQMFADGVGIHHAGMLRADRSLVEELFECGLIKVLCCTATLAWGVNLPAHTVIIKGKNQFSSSVMTNSRLYSGTEIYDPERGGFVDLSVLDVLQIFGRAGRPQYDNSGHAILITQQKSLNMYLGLLAQQTPIESALIKALVDHMNAEIVNGTVNNIREAVIWLSYTFLFVRMKKNPLAYGMKIEELLDDPQLEQKRKSLVVNAAELLDKSMMARFDRRSGNLAVTDLGRIASHYYIKHDTVQSFNSLLSPHMLAPDAMHLLCCSSEFDQLKLRPEEVAELDSLSKTVVVEAKGDETARKVNILLQSFLSQSRINSFTLQSDLNYVAQNGSRIARALFEICLKRGWSYLAKYYLSLCHSIDKRVPIGQSPLRQFAFTNRHAAIPAEVFKRLENCAIDCATLSTMSVVEIGQLVHNQKMASMIKEMTRWLPMLDVQVIVQPITKGIIRLKLTLTLDFDWIEKIHGNVESFWLWIEDSEHEYIYHAEHLLFQRNNKSDPKEFEVIIPVRDPLPSQYFVRVMSDKWASCESLVPIPFNTISMPQHQGSSHSQLLNVHPIPVKALRNPLYESIYKFTHFNPVQSQAFYDLYHTDRNILIGAPTGDNSFLCT